MLYDPKRWPMPEVAPAKPKVQPWQQVLLDAAALIEIRGWCRESFERHGRYCALGAMNKVSGLRPDPDEHTPSKKLPAARLKAEAELSKYIGDNFYGVDDWNDNQTKRKVVIDTMRKVAAQKR